MPRPSTIICVPSDGGKERWSEATGSPSPGCRETGAGIRADSYRSATGTAGRGSERSRAACCRPRGSQGLASPQGCLGPEPANERHWWPTDRRARVGCVPRQAHEVVNFHITGVAQRTGSKAVALGRQARVGRCWHIPLAGRNPGPAADDGAAKAGTWTPRRR